jgi:hypothetical protein
MKMPANLSVTPYTNPTSALVNSNVARAGFDSHRRSAAVDLAGNVVMALDRSLHQHLVVGLDVA